MKVSYPTVIIRFQSEGVLQQANYRPCFVNGIQTGCIDTNLFSFSNYILMKIALHKNMVLRLPTSLLSPQRRHFVLCI